VDPEAADIVFSSGIPIIMSGLDVTHKAMIMADEIAALRKLGGKVPGLAADLMTYFSKYDVGLGFAGAPVHDPCAVACLIAPELFTVRDFHVDIETAGRHTLGMTVADLRFWTKAKPNVAANMDVDRKGFVKLLMDACDWYPK
jgi:pyrimidine-specific ribonucleoside hydrolase